MRGKLIKAIAGFFYISSEDGKVYACKAKGIFRKDKVTPLVGDDVEFEIIDPDSKEGNLVRILPRRNELIRPAVANVDQALVVFAAAKPDPNLNLLDRFLVMMQKQDIHTVICFNKSDIVSDDELYKLCSAYQKCGHEIIPASVREQDNIDRIREVLRGRTTVLAGPSGVGKSSLMNLLAPDAGMETGELSAKIDRGKQTTRHTELIRLEKDTYLFDTPGFTSLYITDMDKDMLKSFFVEFDDYSDKCRFISCNHLSEPDCAVKKALQAGEISSVRYDNYVLLYNELEKQARRKY